MTPQQQLPTGIPQWLEQLFGQGGLQGLLAMIQQQSSYTAPTAPTTADAAGAWGTGGANTPYSNVFGGLNYAPTNGGRVGTDPYGAQYAWEGMPQYRPAYTSATGSTVNAGPYGSIPLTQNQMNQFMDAAGLKGQAFLNALPDPIKPTGVTPDIISNYNTADAALRAAMQAGTVTPELSQAAHAATNALQMAQYGPLYKMIGPQVAAGGASQFNPANMIGGGGVYVPQVRDRSWHPTTTADLAAQYGYAPRSVVRKISTGQIDPATGRPGFTMRADSQSVDSPNVMQTLKHMGWTPGTGTVNWNQAPGAINPQTGKPFTAAQAQMFKDLQASIAPKNPNNPTYLASVARHQADIDSVNTRTPTTSKPSFNEMWDKTYENIQANAYNQQQLGGTYFGGQIPNTSTGAPPDPWTTLAGLGINQQTLSNLGLEAPQDAPNTFDPFAFVQKWMPYGSTPQQGTNVEQPQQTTQTNSPSFQQATSGPAWGSSPWGTSSSWGNNQQNPWNIKGAWG